MSAIDTFLSNNARYAAGFSKGDLAPPPSKKVAIVTCMDARLDTSALLGLEEGDAHVIRNAGGVVTEDVIRSLALSQCLLGTREIMLIHHTGCGMVAFTEEAAKDEIEKQTGSRPAFPLGAFTDLEESVRHSMARIRTTPFIPNTDVIRGFVCDVATGRLREVS